MRPFAFRHARVWRASPVVLVLAGLVAPVTQAARICEPDEAPLFTCETNRQEKVAAICAVETVPGKQWSAVQYRFGKVERAEFSFPPNGRDGAKQLQFSHGYVAGGYQVVVRFRSGDFTYRVYSMADEKSNPPGQGSAGVTVTDSTGKKVADIRCVERPYMFPAYLHDALACDSENPAGKAGCGASPPRLPK